MRKASDRRRSFWVRAKPPNQNHLILSNTYYGQFTIQNDRMKKVGTQ